MNYPYQDRFQLFLNQQGLAPLTIKTYNATLTHFFTFLMDNRPEFAAEPKLKNLTETDVRAFLTALKEDEKITIYWGYYLYQRSRGSRHRSDTKACESWT